MTQAIRECRFFVHPSNPWGKSVLLILHKETALEMARPNTLLSRWPEYWASQTRSCQIAGLELGLKSMTSSSPSWTFMFCSYYFFTRTQKGFRGTHNISRNWNISKTYISSLYTYIHHKTYVHILDNVRAGKYNKTFNWLKLKVNIIFKTTLFKLTENFN